MLPSDDRVELVSGLDLTDREKALEHLQNINGVDKTTHVYFSAYAGHNTDFQELKKVNSALLDNAIDALERCCPTMQYITLQTGGKVSADLRQEATN